MKFLCLLPVLVLWGCATPKPEREIPGTVRVSVAPVNPGDYYHFSPLPPAGHYVESEKTRRELCAWNRVFGDPCDDDWRWASCSR